MRACLFRERDDISLNSLNSVARKIGELSGFNVGVSDHPLNLGDSNVSGGELAERISSNVGNNEQTIALVLTRNSFNCHGLSDENTGENRARWVHCSDSMDESITNAIHALAHLCEVDHCRKKECIMYPFPRPVSLDSKKLKDLLCETCFSNLSGSWVYSRLISSREEKNSNGKVVPFSQNESKAKDQEIKRNEFPSDERKSRFPDWSLPRDEFIERVKEFFSERNRGG